MFQAEYGETNGEVMVHSTASYSKTVRFTEEDQFVYWIFSASSNTCRFDILNVIYFNDGPSENITVWLDEEYIDKFESFNQGNESTLWNYSMLKSGHLGTTKALTAGNHTLNVSASSVDVHGVEIDGVKVGVQCDDIKECFESLILFGPSINVKVVPLLEHENSRSGMSWTQIISITIGVIGLCVSLLTMCLGILFFVCTQKESTSDQINIQFYNHYQ